MNRALPETPDPVFLPSERLDLVSALAVYTAGSAHVNHLDDTGSLRPGYRADLIVLDCDPGSLAETRVGLTYVDGRRVHSSLTA